MFCLAVTLLKCYRLLHVAFLLSFVDASVTLPFCHHYICNFAIQCCTLTPVDVTGDVPELDRQQEDGITIVDVTDSIAQQASLDGSPAQNAVESDGASQSQVPFYVSRRGCDTFNYEVIYGLSGVISVVLGGFVMIGTCLFSGCGCENGFHGVFFKNNYVPCLLKFVMGFKALYLCISYNCGWR